MNAEVHVLLNKLMADSAIHSNEVIEQARAHTARFDRLKSELTIQQVRELLEGVADMADAESGTLEEWEVMQLGNLVPETVEQAVHLIPSLSRLEADDLQRVLDDIYAIRRRT